MRILFALALTIALFTSCKKDNNDDTNQETPNPVTKNYFPLKIGNYWVYEQYKIDTLGVATSTNQIDSVIITRDTVINNNTYFVMEGRNYPFNGGNWGIVEISRDSSGYLVNPDGFILLAPNRIGDTLATRVQLYGGNDTMFILYGYMEQPTTPVTVQAGTFDVIDFKVSTVYYQPLPPGTTNPRYSHNMFAENVGRVLTSYFFSSSSNHFERRLIRYHVDIVCYPTKSSID
ncbi:MAG: hypothetical protein JXR34_05560 [Bacteroidales bacterium]|nr:hypothetical protein [Bacteroidales bacterium]